MRQYNMLSYNSPQSHIFILFNSHSYSDSLNLYSKYKQQHKMIICFFFQQFPEHPLCAPHNIKLLSINLESDLEDTINDIKNLNNAGLYEI